MNNAEGTDIDRRLLEEIKRCPSVSEKQIAQIESKVLDHSLSVLSVLSALNLDSNPEIIEVVARVLDVAYIDLDNFEVNEEDLAILSRETAYKYKVLPLFRMGTALTVGMTNPTDIEVIDALHEETSMEIEACLVSKLGLERALYRYYTEADANFLNIVNDFDVSQFQLIDFETIEQADNDTLAPVAKMFMELVTSAIRVRASDIHIEPGKNMLQIRYRIDGILKDISELPVYLSRPLTSHIKVLSSLQITETRRPQDGRHQTVVDGREIDMRISVVPTIFGETIVIRLLGSDNVITGLDKLGFSQHNLKTIEKMFQNPWGMVLVSGPTGSGKTTTLFTALEHIKSREKKIITIEDPVEYKFDDIRQIQVNSEVGLTFATGLRSILRQDPDIVLVGEIRDAETASIAIQAALTGHLVLSTLHTNDASRAVARLIDMGIPPYLISSSLVGVIGQRLVRKICPYCKTNSAVDAERLQIMGYKLEENKTPHVGAGCPKCLNTGYIGRTVIAEALSVSEEIRRLIMNRASSDDIKNAACKEGMTAMSEEGMANIMASNTTLSEVVRAIGLEC